MLARPRVLRDDVSRMKVFVTGGSGFVGGHLIERLVRDGHEVVAMARSDRSAERVAKVRENEAELLRELAELRLDPEVRGELTSPLSAAEQKAHKMLASHAEALDLADIYQRAAMGTTDDEVAAGVLAPDRARAAQIMSTFDGASL